MLIRWKVNTILTMLQVRSSQNAWLFMILKQVEKSNLNNILYYNIS